MSDGGKGSARRPGTIPAGVWGRIFDKPAAPVKEQPAPVARGEEGEEDVHISDN